MAVLTGMQLPTRGAVFEKVMNSCRMLHMDSQSLD